MVILGITSFPIAMHWATGNEDIVTCYTCDNQLYAFVKVRLTENKIPSLA